jgi:Transglycosylase SLT domain
VIASSLHAAERSRGARAALAPPVATIALIWIAIAIVVAAAMGGVGVATGSGGGESSGTAPSSLALREIPPRYLQLYEQAAARYGLDWAVLAGIGRVECDHGRDADPSCTQEGAVNAMGAAGPMQFIASTWARYGVDGDGDGRIDRWDPADAIFAAANYLAHSGAPSDYARAIFAYNHADSYVSEVEIWAARYRGSSQPGSSTTVQTTVSAPLADATDEGPESDLALQSETPTPVRFVAGERAMLDPSDGHVALIPTAAPSVVAAMLVAGDELQTLPYGPAGHPDPRDAPEEDCSSTVNYVLYRSGVRPIAEILRENPLAQDYVHWGAPGPGRWVTVYATTSPTDHVFMTIAGLRLDTSHDGTDVGPNRDEDGPRWRIFDHIPTWAHWAVRHPPGL